VGVQDGEDRVLSDQAVFRSVPPRYVMIEENDVDKLVWRAGRSSCSELLWCR
jgi:hypothetical protein